MSKFQLRAVKWFLSYKRINKFSTQKSQFFYVFVSQFTITWPTIHKIGTHDALINSYFDSEFQLSRFYCLLVVSKSILICQNTRTKTKIQCACAKSQLKSVWFLSYCTLCLWYAATCLSEGRSSNLHSRLYLKGYSARNNFCSVPSQKNLTDLKTNFTTFELPSTFHFHDMAI